MCAALRRMREAAGMTQRNLAEKLGLHHTMVHRSEIGDRRIDPMEFASWCQACGLDPGDTLRSLVAEK